MRWKAMSIGIAFFATALGTTSAMAQSSPPPSSKAQETEALVNKAAALIDAKGRAAFSEFRVKGTEWFHGDTYLFAYDLKGNVLLNPLSRRAREPTSAVKRTPTGSYFTMPLSGQPKLRDRGGLTTCFRNLGRHSHRRSGPL